MRDRLSRLDPTTALAIAAVLVVAGVLAGVAGARLLPRGVQPLATRAPIATAPAGAAADTETLVFQQPLRAGCATSRAVWVVSDGGGIARFDGERWSLVDPSLRSLVGLACGADFAIGVGPGGRVVTIDDAARSIQPDQVSPDDLLGVSLLGQGGALVVGRAGAVQRFAPGGWGPYARGLTEDLYGVVAFSPTSAWVVGSGGATYRLEEAGWRPVASGVTSTMRAVAARDVGSALAVGERGTIIRFADRWSVVPSGVAAALRSVALVGTAAWIVGDLGTVLRIPDLARPFPARFDLGTSCTLRAVFARGDEVWIVGSDAPRSAVWRLRGDRVADRWGTC